MIAEGLEDLDGRRVHIAARRDGVERPCPCRRSRRLHFLEVARVPAPVECRLLRAEEEVDRLLASRVLQLKDRAQRRLILIGLDLRVRLALASRAYVERNVYFSS